MNQTEEPDLKFAVFISLTAEQGKEKKHSPKQKSQRPSTENLET